MTKDRSIQREVQHAVKEYVDQLISERRGPGKGMAVSAADLMAASRYAAVHKKPAELNVSDFAVTGMKLIAATPRSTTPDVRLQGSKLTTEPIKVSTKKKKSTEPCAKEKKSERHWLTWRTTPTPTPKPSTPAPPTPKPSTPPSLQPVRRPSARPQSARPPSQYKARNTPIPPPRNPTPAPRNPTPAPALSVMSEVALPSDLVLTPEPILLVDTADNRPMSVAEVVDRRRPATPAVSYSARQATPADLSTQYRDVLYSPPQHDIPYHHHQGNYVSHRQPSQTFVPALKAWVNSANDYERDVAYSLFQALGGKAPDAHKKPIRPRPKSAMAKTYHSKRRDPPAGVKTTMSAWEAYHGQDLALTGQSAFTMGGQGGGHGTNQRKVFPPNDYTCKSSFFVNSMRPFKPDFTINPEWSSEMKPSSYPYKPNTKAAHPDFRY